MKIHKLSKYINFRYPVGSNISDSIKKAKELFHLSLPYFEKEIEDKEVNFIVRGSSGAIIGTIFSQELMALYPDKNIYLIHIKKEGEQAHSSGVGIYENQINIFVDDLMSSGETILKTIKTIKDYDLTYSDFIFDYIVLGKYLTIHKFKVIEELSKNLIIYNVK